MRWLVMVVAALLAAPSMAGSGFKLVAHPEAGHALTHDQASRIFLKKTSAWPDGRPAYPVDQVEGTVRDAFSRVVHGKATSAVKSYWQQQIFSGRGVPPAELRGDAEVLAHVKSMPGAIGYVSESAPEAGVRVVTME